MKALIITTLTFLVLIAVACGGSQEPSPTATPGPTATSRPATPTTPPVTEPTATPEQPSNGTIVEVSLQDPSGSGKYLFAPADFTFDMGETVTFVLTSEKEFHTFTVDELELDVAVDAEETQRVTFTFDKAGEFKLICIPHEFLGMVGTITVQ